MTLGGLMTQCLRRPNACGLNENNQSLINSMTEHEDVIPLGIIRIKNLGIIMYLY